MAYYRACPKCGCNLDPGERCDCEDRADERDSYLDHHTKISPKTGQMIFCWANEEGAYAKKTVC